jgi:transposase
MEVLYSHCAGLDVHKKTVVAFAIPSDEQGNKQVAQRTFETVTAVLLALSDWLSGQGVTHMAMESTGEFWQPVYNLLEDNFEVLVVNAHPSKQVPGRKTDGKDAEWIAEWLRPGLLRGSFIPPQAQRDLRDLTRQRTNLVQDRAIVINRLHKVCEWSNLKLNALVTDMMGVSARARLAALVRGQTQPATLADLAKGRLRQKRNELERALNGMVRAHHRFLLAQHLAQIDFLDEPIERYAAQIASFIAHHPPDPIPPSQAGTDPQGPAGATEPLGWEAAVALFDSHPGINQRMAEQRLAEIGSDMSRWPSDAHLASWAKICPGNHQSAGKRYSSAIGHGNRWLRSALVQVAWAAIQVKHAYPASLDSRLAARRGSKRAIVAVAHHLLKSLDHMLRKREPYRDLGATYLDERPKSSLIHRTVKRFAQLGYAGTQILRKNRGGPYPKPFFNNRGRVLTAAYQGCPKCARSRSKPAATWLA